MQAILVMSCMNEDWLQDVAKAYRVPPLRPTVVKLLLPALEYRLRMVVQDAFKFMRRGKGLTLTVEDINQALASHNLEPLYGLAGESNLERMSFHDHNNHKETEDGAEEEKSRFLGLGMVSLSDMAKAPLPKLPLAPELTMHWLAVDGVQPIIPENPSVLVSMHAHDLGDHPQLSKEMCQFYYRVTGILSSSEMGDRSLRAVLIALGRDNGLQELLPHFSLYFQKEVKASTRSLRRLKTLIAGMEAVWSNPHLHVEFHLQQMLPAVFTCIVASKLSSSAAEDHWSLRAHAAYVIAKVCAKFSSLFPDLQARVCKTYVDAMQPDKSLASIYGGLVGLSALGQNIVRTILLPIVGTLAARVRADTNTKASSLIAREMVTSALVKAVGMYYVRATQLYALRIAPTGKVVAVEQKDKNTPVAKRRKVAGGSHEIDPIQPATVLVQDVAAPEIPDVGAEEPLVRYYASVAPEAGHCRLLL